jgi:hypothetical protein
LRSWLAFIAFVIVAWSLACRALLELAPEHPVPVFIVWWLGFLFGTGYTVTGKTSGGIVLLVYTVGPLAILTVAGSALLLVLHWIS